MKKFLIVLPIIAACNNDGISFESNTPNLVELKEVNFDDQLYPPELVNEYFHYVEYSDIGFSFSRNSGIKLEENGKWQHVNNGSWTGTYNRKWYVDKSSNSLILLYNNRTAHVFSHKDGIWCSNYGCLLSWPDYQKYEQGKPLNDNTSQDENETSISSSEIPSPSKIKSEALVDIQLVPKTNDSRILSSPNINNIHPDWMPPSNVGLSFTFIAFKEFVINGGEKYYQGDLLGAQGSIVTENCYVKADEWE